MDAMVRVPIVSRCAHVTYWNKFELLTKISGTNASCSTAFMSPDQTYKQVACQVDDVCAKLAIFKNLNARYLTIDLGWPGYYLLSLVNGYLERV